MSKLTLKQLAKQLEFGDKVDESVMRSCHSAYLLGYSNGLEQKGQGDFIRPLGNEDVNLQKYLQLREAARAIFGPEGKIQINIDKVEEPSEEAEGEMVSKLKVSLPKNVELEALRALIA